MNGRVKVKKPYVPNFDALEHYVKEGFVRKVISPCGQLMLFNYTDKCTYKRKWTKHTLNARGNVYEVSTGKVVARAFPKFFNFEELPVTRQRGLNKLKDFQVFEKMDGSLGILYFYDGDWHVNTRGSFMSEQAIKANQMLEKYEFQDLKQNYTYLVEIIYPENKIIVDYGDEEKLVLIGAYENYSGKEIEWSELTEISDSTGFPLPKKYDFQSIDEIINTQLSLPSHEEGFVVRLNDGDRIKFKSKEYLKLARLIAYVTPLHFWEHMENGKISEELLEKIPEELRETSEKIRKELEREYRQVRDLVYAEASEIISKTEDSENQRKEIGLMMKGHPFRSDYRHLPCVFHVLDNEHDKVEKYIMKQIRPKDNEFANG